LDKLVAKADKNIENNSYPELEIILDSIENLTSVYALCDFNIDRIPEIRKKYNLPIQYSKMKNAMNEAFDQEDYQMFFNYWQILDSTYSTNDLTYYGIKKISLKDICYWSTNSEFQFSLLKWLIKNEKYYESIAVLTELKNRSYPVDSVTEYQQTVGQSLAIEDYEYNSGLNPKKQVEKYIEDGQWFKPLRRAYLQQWGKLL
jgi:hypothetical protein